VELVDFEAQTNKTLLDHQPAQSALTMNDVFIAVPVNAPRAGELEYRLWTLPDGAPAGGGRVVAEAMAAISLDGRELIYGIHDQLGLLHRDTDVRTPLGSLDQFLYGTTPDLSLLVVKTKSGIAAVSTSDGSRRTLELPAVATYVMLDPEGHRLALGTGSGRVGWVDLDARSLRYDEARGPSGSSGTDTARWSSDGRWVVTTHADGSISVWDPQRRRHVATLDGMRTLVDVVIGGDRSVLALDDRTLRRWADPPSPWEAVASGPTALLGSAGTIVTRRPDDVITVWTPEPIELGSFGAAPEVVVSSDGRLVAIGDEDGVELWHRDDGWLRRIELMSATADFGLRIASDGSSLVVVDTPNISVHDTRSGQERSRVTADWSDIVLLQPDEICGVAEPGLQVECMGLASGQKTRVFPIDEEPHEVAASPKGNALGIVLGRLGILVIDVETGTMRTMQGKLPPVEAQLDFSPDGEILFATTPAGEALGWRVASGVAIDRIVPSPPTSLGIADVLTRDLVWQRVAFVDDTTLLVLDAWDDVRRVELDVPVERTALQQWVAAATTARIDPSAVDWGGRDSAPIK
jgi:hypothetical protein